jgi:Ala-tRNA(Pro) deacylase
MKLLDQLRQRNISFELCPHPAAHCTQRLAKTLHVEPSVVAKTVLLRVNGGYKYLVAILPATHVIDLAKLSQAMGGSKVVLASKEEIALHCPDCEAGALPPFGTMYSIESVVDPTVATNEFVIFEGDSFEEAIRMRYRDFYEAEHPLVIEFAVAPKANDLQK